MAELTLGHRVRYTPSGIVLPIEEDECRDGQCVGCIIELYSGSDRPCALVRWLKCCNHHNELTGGHMTAEMLHEAGVHFSSAEELAVAYPEDHAGSEFSPAPLGCTWLLIDDLSSDMIQSAGPVVPNPVRHCAVLMDEHHWQNGSCSACGRTREPVTPDTPFFIEEETQ